MAKFQKIADRPGEYDFYCPGCECNHGVWTEAPNAVTGAKWEFNGDVNKPTCSPSLLVRWTRTHPVTGLKVQDMVCHSFIKNGYIQFLQDCTHALKGQTVLLPEIE